MMTRQETIPGAEYESLSPSIRQNITSRVREWWISTSAGLFVLQRLFATTSCCCCACSLMKAMKTQEAKDISEWKERPHLVMLLDSIQKGVCLRRLHQTRMSQTPNSSRRSCHYFIPVFSSLSAIFLAHMCRHVVIYLAEQPQS